MKSVLQKRIPFVLLLPVASWLLMMMTSRHTGVVAFTMESPLSSLSSSLMTSRRKTSTTQLHSDIPKPQPKDGGDTAASLDLLLESFQRTTTEQFGKLLPPPPENLVVLTGDLLCLATYGFFDHFVNQYVMTSSLRSADSPAKLSQFLSTTTVASQSTTANEYLLSTPVWLDATSPHHSNVLQVTVHDQVVSSYSPLLQSTGAAVTVLAACWLLSGWFHQAFSYRNTLFCRTDKALAVTAQSWMTCSVLLFTITAMSHWVCGCETITAFTRGDVEYIVDSLSVLTLWRFMASYMLGTGGMDDGSDDL